MSIRSTRIKQLCGIVMIAVSVSLMIAFALSGAWFGVMMGLFVTVVGAKIVLQPDFVLRSGSNEPERGPEG